MCELAADPRIPDDCLFLIFEEDFRFERPAAEFTSEAEYYESRSRLPDFKGMAKYAVSKSRVPPPEHERGNLRDYVNMRNQPKDVWSVGVSEYLEDLVRYATAAHRLNHGDIIWAGWVPGGPGSNPKRKASVGFGSHLLLCSKSGLLTLKDAFANDPDLSVPGHIDIKLKTYLIAHWKEAKACYIWPAIGNYTAHISGCSHEYLESVRPNGWNDKWTRQGTRREHDLQGRVSWLVGWQATGGAQWIQSVDIGQVPSLDRWVTEWACDVPLSEYLHSVGGFSGPADRVHESATLDTTAGSASSSTTMTKRAKREQRRVKQTLRDFRCWKEDESEKADRAVYMN